jgi:hypothetical protein
MRSPHESLVDSTRMMGSEIDPPLSSPNSG